MIQLHEVGMTFPGGATALHPLSIAFGRGEFTVLLGHSGAGKSTLLRCLNFLNRPSSGRITITGIGQLHHSKALRLHRRATGMIFQHHHLIPRQSVLENVLLGRLGYHSAWRSLFPLPRHERFLALEVLDRVGLLHKALERADSLSGGEQQRVGIARALVQKPQIMLADEPVASLDPASSHKILSLLHAICKEDDITAIVSLHQVELARHYADRIVGMRAGKVVLDGRPAQFSERDLAELYSQNTASDISKPVAPQGAALLFNL